MKSEYKVKSIKKNGYTIKKGELFTINEVDVLTDGDLLDVILNRPKENIRRKKGGYLLSLNIDKYLLKFELESYYCPNYVKNNEGFRAFLNKEQDRFWDTFLEVKEIIVA